ncbi:MAG: hypothetical protein WAM30_16960 [Candidatus Dormiibacterota bacterium]
MPEGADAGIYLWILTRIAGLTAYAVLALALLTGLSLRSAVLAPLATNRVLRGTHEFATVLWIPLGVVHLGGLLLDTTAHIGIAQLVVPLTAPYGTLALALGAVSLDLLLLVIASGLLRSTWRSRLPARLGSWVHRLAYLAFGCVFLHALLAGTDFASLLISSIACAIAGALGLLTISRIVWGRLAD